MSVKLSSYVWDGCAASGMKLTCVTIMARLADFSNDNGECWPAIGTIARQIGAGESTVRNAVSALEREGWLTRTGRRKGNRNTSNLYKLNVEKLRKAASSHPAESDVSKSGVPDSSEKESFHPPESGDDPSVN